MHYAIRISYGSRDIQHRGTVKTSIPETGFCLAVAGYDRGARLQLVPVCDAELVCVSERVPSPPI